MPAPAPDVAEAAARLVADAKASIDALVETVVATNTGERDAGALAVEAADMVRGAATVVAAQAAKSLDGIEEATGRVGAHAYGGLCELGTAFSGTPTEAAAAAREWYVEAGPRRAAGRADRQGGGAPAIASAAAQAQAASAAAAAHAAAAASAGYAAAAPAVAASYEAAREAAAPAVAAASARIGEAAAPLLEAASPAMHAAREQFDAAVATVGSLGGSAVADGSPRRRRAGGGRRGGGGRRRRAARRDDRDRGRRGRAGGGRGRVMVAIFTGRGRVCVAINTENTVQGTDGATKHHYRPATHATRYA